MGYGHWASDLRKQDTVLRRQNLNGGQGRALRASYVKTDGRDSRGKSGRDTTKR